MFASDDFLVASVPGLEEGRGRLGVSATAGFRAPRGIPIELFLMCFNFHFLLLENTDGDLLPLTHTEQGADRESSVQQTYVRPSHAWGTGASNQLLRLLRTSVSPVVKWGWLRRSPNPLPAPQSRGSGLEQGRGLQLDIGSKGHRV